MDGKVEINLQDLLRDMENRLVREIRVVAVLVKEQNGRVRVLEAQQYKLRWLWRTVTGLCLGAFGWVWTQASHHLGELLP